MSGNNDDGNNEPGRRLPREALGRSEAFLAFQEQLSAVAKVDRPVLLVGERGTGKELAAMRLHYLSRRWEHPLVTLNCSALAPTLIESELFGYEAGAFTGADKARAGRFEHADQGTLFLDELANIPLPVQEKILRVVEYGGFERVGSSSSIEVDVRIVGATHADLRQLAAEERFMRDLLDRLSFEVLVLPPLRERQGDILLLANHFAGRMAYEIGMAEIPAFSKGARQELENYAWPGNIRELKNVVERAVYRSGGGKITAIVFDPFPSSCEGGMPPLSVPGGAAKILPHDKGLLTGGSGKVIRDAGEIPGADKNLLDKPLRERVREMELKMLKLALEKARHNQRKAAEMLGLTYHQFRGLYRKHADALAE